jgi:hypothetical protein
MKVIKVIQIEACNGSQYLIRRDKPWADELHQIIDKLIADKRVGSIAHVSLGTVDEEVYLGIPNVGQEIKSVNLKKRKK